MLTRSGEAHRPAIDEVAAYAELLRPRALRLTTFPNDGGVRRDGGRSRDPVLLLCGHHLLAFLGVAHVAYLPGDRILGLSGRARVVEMSVGRLRVQERLTRQIATWLREHLQPKGVGVLEAEHTGMSIRGVRAPGTETVTSALLGVLRDDPRTRTEFLALAKH